MVKRLLMTAAALSALFVGTNKVNAADYSPVNVTKFNTKILGESWEGATLSTQFGVTRTGENNLVGFVVGPGLFISNNDESLVLNSTGFVKFLFDDQNSLNLELDVNYVKEFDRVDTEFELTYFREI